MYHGCKWANCAKIQDNAHPSQLQRWTQIEKGSIVIAKILTAVAKLEAGMRFDAQATSGYHVTLDSNEVSGGQDSGFSPM